MEQEPRGPAGGETTPPGSDVRTAPGERPAEFSQDVNPYSTPTGRRNQAHQQHVSPDSLSACLGSGDPLAEAHAYQNIGQIDAAVHPGHRLDEARIGVNEVHPLR